MMNVGAVTSVSPLNSVGAGMMGGALSGSISPLNSSLGVGMMTASPVDPFASNFAAAAPLMSGVGFTIAGGHVTGMQELIGTHMANLGLPANATFAVGANHSVMETVSNGNTTTTMQFAADASIAGGYRLMAETVNFAHASAMLAGNQVSGYSFTIANGAVTGMQEVLGTTAHPYTLNLAILPTAAFSISGNTVTETLAQGNTLETRSFVTAGGNGLYALAADSLTFVQPGTATTLLSVSPYERDKFTIDGSGHVTAVQAMQANGNFVAVTPDSHTSFAQLAPGFVAETVTIGTHSSYEVFHDGNADGIYTAVAHGTGTTVDLVGLHAQLAPALEALL